MKFLASDDSMLLMDIPNIDGHLFSEEELRALRDAGVRTTMMFGNDINLCNPSDGVYAWEIIDGYVERATRCGLNVMIPTYTQAPLWGPDHWYAHTRAGILRGLISPWSAAGQEYLLNHYQMLVDRYASRTVAIVNTQLTNGETILINEAAYYDAAAAQSYHDEYGSSFWPNRDTREGDERTDAWMRKSYLSMMQTQARVLSTQPAQLMFSAIHPAIADFGLYGNGNKWYADLLAMYRDTYPEHDIVWVLYTWAQWSYYHPIVRALKDSLGLRVYGGAEYAEGLPGNTPIAIEAGIDGQFLGPCHPFTGHRAILPFMLENIRAAIGQWNSARG